MALLLQDGKLRTPAQKDTPWNLEDGKLRSLSEKQTNVVLGGTVAGVSSFTAALNVIEPIVLFEAEVAAVSSFTAALKVTARFEALIAAASTSNAALIVIGAGSAPIPPEEHDIILVENDLDIILANSI